jgi:hypothetical protein
VSENNVGAVCDELCTDRVAEGDGGGVSAFERIATTATTVSVGGVIEGSIDLRFNAIV